MHVITTDGKLLGIVRWNHKDKSEADCLGHEQHAISVCDPRSEEASRC